MATIETIVATKSTSNDILSLSEDDLPVDLSCHNRRVNKKCSVSTPTSRQSFNKHLLDFKTEQKVSVDKTNNNFASSSHKDSSECNSLQFSSILKRTSRKTYPNHSGKVANYQPHSPGIELYTYNPSCSSIQISQANSNNLEKNQHSQTAALATMQQLPIDPLPADVKTRLNDKGLERLFLQLRSFVSQQELEKMLSSVNGSGANLTLTALLSSTHLSANLDELICGSGQRKPENSNRDLATKLVEVSDCINPYKEGFPERTLAYVVSSIPGKKESHMNQDPVNETRFVEHHRVMTPHQVQEQQMPSLFQHFRSAASQSKNVFLPLQPFKNSEDEFLRQLNLCEKDILQNGNNSRHAFSNNEMRHTMSHYKLQQNTMVEQKPPRPVNFKPCKIVCRVCGRTYATEGSLLKHMKTHENPTSENTFKCKICKKTCSTLGALRMHIRTHTLPCECHICGKAFSRTWLLQGHIRTHTGEKPYECPKCSRAFADRSNLRAHMQTHEAIKRYSCQGCDKTFSRISLLKRHQRHCIHPPAAKTHREQISEVETNQE